MIDWSAAVLMLAALGGVPDEPNAAAPIEFAQMTIRQQIRIRIPARLQPEAKVPVPIEWKESKGPKCVAARSIIGATALRDRSFDIVMRDKSRMRARLDRSCPALDYYYGFYISPDADGQICADRDSIRSRVGGECEIDAFRKLRAAARD
nr:hypothetical protein [uncultured Sphingosinicella sp.]